MLLPALGRETLREKILGCWVGKNCGGTLGAPLEKPYSEEAPFAITFYPRLQDGGIPNDDLELQLIWLKALEEVGLNIGARDLAQYWLKHVVYNFDEYGLMKANFRLGLHPPMSGFYNNFFKHSMGCPIRTEIWACIAPGNPRLAAHYALEDSICDHAGGESINGSLFNVTVESAAFVLSDPSELIEIGLSYLQPESLTARCVRAAWQAHNDGLDWLEARQEVLAIGANPIAQFSPPNIAFQVVGWLYGADFGDALCKAVNCGYDTDCTGATLGSILGIIAGETNIPDRWKAPLGMAIATNESTGGLRELSTGSNPVPKKIDELTDRVFRIQQQIECKSGAPGRDLKDLYADGAILKEAARSPTVVSFPGSSMIDMQLDYGPSPQVITGEEKEISIRLEHDLLDTQPVSLFIEVPVGWACSPARIDSTLIPHTSWTATTTLRATHRSHLLNRNEVIFRLVCQNLPTLAPASLSLIGAPAYLRSPIYSGEEGMSTSALLERCFEPENGGGDHQDGVEKGLWQVCHADGNDVAPCLDDFSSGVIYLKRWVKSATDRTLWMHHCSTVPSKVWINGKVVFNSPISRRFRPAAWGTEEGGLHGEISLREGWNELLFKFAANSRTPALQCHIIFSDHRNYEAIVVDLLGSQFPWDEAGLTPEATGTK